MKRLITLPAFVLCFWGCNEQPKSESYIHQTIVDSKQRKEITTERINEAIEKGRKMGISDSKIASGIDEWVRGQTVTGKEQAIIDRAIKRLGGIYAQQNYSNSGNIHYYNPNTGYEADYTLDADVDADGHVSTIYFNNGGYIDESHIVSEEVEDGVTIIEDDRGRTFEIDNEVESVEEE